MRIFGLKQNVKLDDAVILRARQFAESVIDTVDYRDSNQPFREKVQLDHFISKIGEEAVGNVFRQYGCEVTGPDYRIYDGKQKSWDCDLRIDGIGLAVKTQSASAAKKYGLSWTFQDAPKRRDIILDQPDAWVCFVLCDDFNSHNCVVYPVLQIHQLSFRPPRLAHLHGKKQVVYSDDIERLL